MRIDHAGHERHPLQINVFIVGRNVTFGHQPNNARVLDQDGNITLRSLLNPINHLIRH